MTLESLQATRVAQETDEKLARWIREQYSQMKSARTKIEMTWYVNLAFYRGNQYVELIPRLSKLTVPKAPPYRVRHVSNRIRPIIRTELARLTTQKPSASIIPASSDDEDQFAAYAGEQIWESISNRGKLQETFERSCWWMLITGTSFLKTWWDPSTVDTESGQEGDVCYGSVSPFHLFVPDLREEDIQAQPYLINAYTKPVAWVKRFYGDRVKDMPINPDVTAANEILDDAYLQLDSNATQPDQVLCLELWAKAGATDDITEDTVIHVIGDKVVSRSPMYNHGQYPFVRFGHIPTGTFYCESVINDLIPLQREYNRTRSQIIEAKNRMAKPQLLVARGSVDVSKMTTEPGQAIEYRPGLPAPTPLPLQSLPPYVIQEQERITSDMEDISGQHAVSHGGVPPGVTAATAISYLQEQDDSLLTHTFHNIEKGMEVIAKQTLELFVQFADTQRLIKVVGDDGFFDTLMLQGSDLANNTDIRMEGGSALPTSKAAKQALLMDLMKMQFIDPQDGLKLMDIGGVQKLWQRIKTDESQAQRENIRLKNTTPDQIAQNQQGFQQMQEQEMQALQMGQLDPAQAKTIDQNTGQPLAPPTIVPVNTWDNHASHVIVHNNYRKSQSFELLSEEVKQQFEAHVNAHLAAAQSAMMEAQGMMQGMPPGGPDQSGSGGVPDPNAVASADTAPTDPGMTMMGGQNG